MHEMNIICNRCGKHSTIQADYIDDEKPVTLDWQTLCDLSWKKLARCPHCKSLKVRLDTVNVYHSITEPE